jgi:hypothetical protein
VSKTGGLDETLVGKPALRTGAGGFDGAAGVRGALDTTGLATVWIPEMALRSVESPLRVFSKWRTADFRTAIGEAFRACGPSNATGREY